MVENDAGATPNLASRAGLKLLAALDAWDLSIAGLAAADLGSSNGGFVDILLRRGARKVYAVEKGYGILDWRLRNDPRVVVMERTDATSVWLDTPVDLVTIDAGFTRQAAILPRAKTLLSGHGMIISLVKPQYEASGRELVRGRLTEELRSALVDRAAETASSLGLQVEGRLDSPVAGSGGAIETFLHLTT